MNLNEQDYENKRRSLKSNERKRLIKKCDLCGVNLYSRERWLVKLYVLTPFGPIELKVLHLCRDCLSSVKVEAKGRKNLRIKYRKMRPLKARRNLQHRFIL